jgi:hypothetical protein
MSKYFCIGKFIELLKEKYPRESKILICSDPRKSVEETKYNQLQYHSYGLILK